MDYVAFSGHKLYAPYGAGVLVGRGDWLDAAEPYLAGGGATQAVTSEETLWQCGPARHEAGSPNVLGAVALGAACQVVERERVSIDALEAEDAPDVDITLKIETVEAFRQLPRMLLEAMRWRDVGVMIARGDLAVEAGFARMAELQEEILWLCEAAHVPAIWATQVLESLAKTGLPSRAEITDAAMAQRAEAAMLNKGPYIDRAVTVLGDILGRMHGHASKKRDMLRRLESWSL